MPPRKEPPKTGKSAVKRAAIYARVSTIHQVDKDSLPLQKQELVGFCKYSLGIEDYIIFEDAGYSGKNTDRPAFQRMLEQIRNGLFTHLVVWKIDRISRNLLDFATMYAELKKLGVAFVSKNEQFDTSSSMGEAMLKIILVFAELERGMTSERVTATMINRASNGVWNGGRVHFGYSYDKEKQVFSLAPEEAPIARMMFDEYENSCSLVQVTRRLNSLGYRTRYGNMFSPVTVQLVLRNPWYKGTYRYNYYKFPSRHEVKDESEWVLVDNHHPAIVEASQFARVQEILNRNKRFRNEPGRSIHCERPIVFAGLLWCADCGSAMVASPGRIHVSGYRPSKYACPKAARSKECPAKIVSDTIIGEFLLNYVLNIMNAQKEFAVIRSLEELERRLLRGSTFEAVSGIDHDGLETLWDMLSKFQPSDSVFASKYKPRQKMDPELKRLRREKQKQERALERLNHIYLYGDSNMPDREYIVRKQTIIDALGEVNEAIGLVQQEPWNSSLSDEDFIAAASSFIMAAKMQERQYVYFVNLAKETDSGVLKSFFQSIIDSVYIRAGKVESVVFRNGLAHKFTYNDSKAGE